MDEPEGVKVSLTLSGQYCSHLRWGEWGERGEGGGGGGERGEGGGERGEGGGVEIH